MAVTSFAEDKKLEVSKDLKEIIATTIDSIREGVKGIALVVGVGASGLHCWMWELRDLPLCM